MRIHSVRLQHLGLLEEIHLRCFRTLTSDIKVKNMIQTTVLKPHTLFFFAWPTKSKQRCLFLISRYETVITAWKEIFQLLDSGALTGWCMCKFELKGHLNEPHLPL